MCAYTLCHAAVWCSIYFVQLLHVHCIFRSNDYIVGRYNVLACMVLHSEYLYVYRYNVLVVERDYSSLTPSKWLSWADLSISQGVGILIRPISILASAEDGKTLILTVTALSLQYQTCWVVLYHQDQNRSGKYKHMYIGALDVICVYSGTCLVVPHLLTQVEMTNLETQ